MYHQYINFITFLDETNLQLKSIYIKKNKNIQREDQKHNNKFEEIKEMFWNKRNSWRFL